jgi:hypothetical protein
VYDEYFTKGDTNNARNRMATYRLGCDFATFVSGKKNQFRENKRRSSFGSVDSGGKFFSKQSKIKIAVICPQ